MTSGASREGQAPAYRSATSCPDVTPDMIRGTIRGMTVFTEDERQTFAAMLADDETYHAESDPSGLLINCLVEIPADCCDCDGVCDCECHE